MINDMISYVYVYAYIYIYRERERDTCVCIHIYVHTYTACDMCYDMTTTMLIYDGIRYKFIRHQTNILT